MVIPYMCCGGLCGGVVNDPQTPDLEVRGLSLAHCVVSLDKEFTPLCLSSPRSINVCSQHTGGG